MAILNIPKTIRVGYQDRKDTYTGKLAYVTYLRQKNQRGDIEVAKEASWSGWIDEGKGVDDFENCPTEGFVLNKKVGDYHYSSWDSRMAKIRIYDPRGFEFEITPDNLLWILECCNSIRGKGLEGEFVYGWSGADLVLVPCESQDYIDSKKIINKTKTSRLKASDLVVGKKYRHVKTGKVYTYIGKRRRYKIVSNIFPGTDIIPDGYVQSPIHQEEVYGYNNWTGRRVISQGKRWFKSQDEGNAWWFENGGYIEPFVSIPSIFVDADLDMCTQAELATYLKLLDDDERTKIRDFQKDFYGEIPFEEFKVRSYLIGKDKLEYKVMPREGGSFDGTFKRSVMLKTEDRGYDTSKVILRNSVIYIGSTSLWSNDWKEISNDGVVCARGVSYKRNEEEDVYDLKAQEYLRRIVNDSEFFTDAKSIYDAIRPLRPYRVFTDGTVDRYNDYSDYY